VVIATAAIAASVAVYYFMTHRSGPEEVTYEITTASGLKIHDVKVGDGASPMPGQMVRVNYIGCHTPTTGGCDTNPIRGDGFIRPGDFWRK